MKIIDRLPFADRPHFITVRGDGRVQDQIFVWLSIDDVLRPLPTILDKLPTILDKRCGINLPLSQSTSIKLIARRSGGRAQEIDFAEHVLE